MRKTDDSSPATEGDRSEAVPARAGAARAASGAAIGSTVADPATDDRPAEPGVDGTDRPAAGAADGSVDAPETGVTDATDTEATWDDLEDFDDDATAGTWDDRLLAPAPKKSRRQKRKEWRQSEKARRYAARRSVRFPIFTRSVILWLLLFAMTGAAFGGSGAFFWAHFNTQINELREQTKDFDKRSQEAQGQIDAMRNQAITDINQQLKPIAPYLAETKTIQLAQVFSQYVWFVTTLDEEGKASVGTAFPVVTDANTTLLVTSLNTVRAASVTPAPEIELRKSTTAGTDSVKAQVVNFDANRDLALLSVPRGNMPVLDWATDDQQAQALGLRVFPVSGFGGAGASLTSGTISDLSAAGFMHNATVGYATQGGPIVTADAKVLGVSSLTYRPLGFDNGDLHFSISINQVCAELMECGGGARRAKETKKPPAPAPKPGPAPAPAPAR